MDRWSLLRATACAVGAAFAMLLAAGCDGQVSPQSQQLLTSGVDSYKKGDDRAAITAMDEFLRQNPHSKAVDKAYYIRGLAYYRQNQINKARSDLNAALEGGQTREVRVGSMKALGDMSYDTDDMPTAESMYRQALLDMDITAAPADQVMYRLGCTLQRVGRWADADVQFDRVEHYFKGGELAKRSAKRVRCVAWTIQAGVYKDRAAASAAAQEMRVAKLAASTSEFLDGRPVYIVLVGKYPTFEQASSALAEVRKLSADAFVTTTR